MTDPLPSSASIRSADEAQALTAKGLCPFCKRRMTDETCPCWNKEND